MQILKKFPNCTNYSKIKNMKFFWTTDVHGFILRVQYFN